MARRLVRYVLIALVVAVLVFGAVTAAKLWFFRQIVSGVAGAVETRPEGQQVVQRVNILDGVDPGQGGYALVLEDLVTGQGPRLIRDSAVLEGLKPQLWYEVTRIEGGLFPAARDSARARTPVATLMKDGVAIRSFSCPTDNCGGWFGAGDREGAKHSGFDALRQAATPPGVGVEHMTGLYDTYDSYRSAHAAVLADPDRWFAAPGAETLLAPDDGMGEIRVSLPVVLLPYAANAATSETEATFATRLEELAQGWLGDVEGNIQVQHSWPAEIYIDWETGYGGDTRPLTLPGVSYRERGITLSVPLSTEARVAARIDLSDFPPPDLLTLEDALHQAVAVAGFDTSCLPGCARVQSQRIKHSADVYIRPAPSWQIESWRLMATEE